jgi:arginase
MSQVCIVEVPFAVGDDRHAASGGPRRYLEAGAEDVIARLGMDIIVERVDRGEPFHDSVSASRAVGESLASVILALEQGGRVPLVLAGSCDASIGILAGMDDRSHCGAVWFDAHGDFNTPESTESGFFPGMSLAVVTGHCYQQMWGRMGNAEPLPERMVLMLGVRDLSPTMERERLEASEIELVSWEQGRPTADVGESIEELATRVDEVYLHVDNDALDPAVAPGVSDVPAAGGLSLEQLEDAIRTIASQIRIRAASLTNFNPDRDEGDRTLEAGLRIIGAIGSALG